MNPDKPIVVVVDGIIGAGKTSYLQVLEEDLKQYGLRVTMVREPVEKWKECGILQRFYEDKSRWAYHFQAKAFHDRILENIKAWDNHKDHTDIFILERSCFTDNLFMDMLYDSQTIDSLELQHYREWWELWSRIMPYLPDVFIYLKPDVEVCMRRLRFRNREGEENIPQLYQEALEKKHNEFFDCDYIDLSKYMDVAIAAPDKKDKQKARVVKLTTNKEFLDDPEARKEIVEQFLEIIKDIKR
jgi:deoxyadenosine/deoxycytidine kinase